MSEITGLSKIYTKTVALVTITSPPSPILLPEYSNLVCIGNNCITVYEGQMRTLKMHYNLDANTL